MRAEAAEFIRARDLVSALSRAGRVIPLGSAFTGLMVWRDIDFGVDATGISAREAWSKMWPLLADERCLALHYENERGLPDSEARHYFVARIEAATGARWKLDVSLWTEGVPADVEPFQARLEAGLPDELRLAILRLKDVWHREPTYPEVVGGFEIYDAVLEHGARTLDDVDAYLQERGLPTLRSESE